MKTYIILIIALIVGLITSSCDKDDDLLDFYKSQNRSEELKGWWKRIEYPENEHSNYYIFEGFMFKQASYSITEGKYIVSTDFNYWYNTENTIYVLKEGWKKSKDRDSTIPFRLNTTKDTLQLYNSQPVYFVKELQPQN